MSKKLKIAVLISGQGRTFLNLLKQTDNDQLDIEIISLVSTRPQTPALAAAHQKGIPTVHVSYKSLGQSKATEKIYQACQGAELIVMAGFLKHLTITPEWQGRVINIHPSLLPKFGGKGFYGHRVHQAVLAAGEKETGCSVHLVDNEYDHGPVLDRLVVSVKPKDTVDELAARVFEQEKILYPRVIQKIASGQWSLPLSAHRVYKK